LKLGDNNKLKNLITKSAEAKQQRKREEEYALEPQLEKRTDYIEIKREADCISIKPKAWLPKPTRRRRLFYGENVTFASLPNAKTAAEISENPSRYLCALGYFSFASLIDIKSLPPAHSLHSLCKRAVQRGNDSILNHEWVDNNCLDKFGMDRHPIIYAAPATHGAPPTCFAS
jgi:hypothetical protein